MMADLAGKSPDPATTSVSKSRRNPSSKYDDRDIVGPSSSDSGTDIPARAAIMIPAGKRTVGIVSLNRTDASEGAMDVNGAFPSANTSTPDHNPPDLQDSTAVDTLNGALNGSKSRSSKLDTEKTTGSQGLGGVLKSISEMIMGSSQNSRKSTNEPNTTERHITESSPSLSQNVTPKFPSPSHISGKATGQAIKSKKLPRPTTVYADLKDFEKSKMPTSSEPASKSRPRGKPDPYDMAEDDTSAMVTTTTQTVLAIKKKPPRARDASKNISGATSNETEAPNCQNGGKGQHAVVDSNVPRPAEMSSPPAPKRRGRPPKAKPVPQVVDLISEEAETTRQAEAGTGKTRHAQNRDRSNDIPAQVEEQAQVEQPQGAEIDEESLPMDMNEQGHGQTDRTEVAGSQSRSPVNHSVPSVNDILPNSSPVKLIVDRQAQNAAKTLSSLETYLATMEKYVDQIGCNDKGRRGAPTKKLTAPCKTFLKVTGRLLSSYTKMEKLKQAQPIHFHGIQNEHVTIEQHLEKLENVVNSILTERLGDKSSGGNYSKETPESRRTSMLHDLYLHIAPEYVAVLRAAVNCYKDNGVLSASSLKEVAGIADQFEKLLEASKAEPTELQPRQKKGQKYTLRGPSQRFAPQVRSFLDECQRWQTSQKAAARATELEAKAPDHSRKRRELADAEKLSEEEDYRHRLRERKRAIMASLNVSRARLGLPLCGSQISATQTFTRPSAESITPVISISSKAHEIAEQQEILQKARRRLRELNQAEEQDIMVSQPSCDGEENDEEGEYYDIDDMLTDIDDPFADEVDDNRLQMFGKNNANEASRQKPWTRIEMETLVDGLKQCQGDDRYEIISTRLDRSLEEIFEWAKNFKITMEEDHLQRQQRNPGRRLPPLESYITSIRIGES